MIAYKHVQKLQHIWVHHALVQHGCRFLDTRYEAIYPVAMQQLHMTRKELDAFIQDELRQVQ